MKRLLLVTSAIVLMAVPYVARAQGMDGPYDSWTGWYAGLELGLNHNSYDGYGASNSMTTTLEGGYDYRANMHLVVGGDLYSEWNSDTNHNLDAFPNLNVNYGSRSYGADFLFGFPVNNFLPYIKLGYGHVSISGDLNGSNNSMRYGLGAIWRINPSSGVLLQYMYQKASIPNTLGNGDFKNGNLTVGYNWYFNY